MMRASSLVVLTVVLGSVWGAGFAQAQTTPSSTTPSSTTTPSSSTPSSSPTANTPSSNTANTTNTPKSNTGSGLTPPSAAKEAACEAAAKVLYRLLDDAKKKVLRDKSCQTDKFNEQLEKAQDDTPDPIAAASGGAEGAAFAPQKVFNSSAAQMDVAAVGIGNCLILRDECLDIDKSLKSDRKNAGECRGTKNFDLHVIEEKKNCVNEINGRKNNLARVYGQEGKRNVEAADAINNVSDSDSSRVKAKDADYEAWVQDAVNDTKAGKNKTSASAASANESLPSSVGNWLGQGTEASATADAGGSSTFSSTAGGSSSSAPTNNEDFSAPGGYSTPGSQDGAPASSAPQNYSSRNLDNPSSYVNTDSSSAPAGSAATATNGGNAFNPNASPSPASATTAQTTNTTTPSTGGSSGASNNSSSTGDKSSSGDSSSKTSGNTSNNSDSTTANNNNNSSGNGTSSSGTPSAGSGSSSTGTPSTGSTASTSTTSTTSPYASTSSGTGSTSPAPADFAAPLPAENVAAAEKDDAKKAEELLAAKKKQLAAAAAAGNDNKFKNIEMESGLPSLNDTGPGSGGGGGAGSGGGGGFFGGGGSGRSPSGTASNAETKTVKKGLFSGMMSSISHLGGSGGGRSGSSSSRPWWRPSMLDGILGTPKTDGDASASAAEADPDLRRFLPGADQDPSTSARAEAKLHGPETVLFQAVKGRYYSLEPTFLDESGTTAIAATGSKPTTAAGPAPIVTASLETRAKSAAKVATGAPAKKSAATAARAPASAP